MGSIGYEDEDQVKVEVRDVSPAHYLLKIESFSLLSESGIDKYESNEFEAGGYKWKMIIYPDGNGSEHISVYLAISGTSSLPARWEINAIFTFFLLNQKSNNYLTVRGKMQRLLSVNSKWGLSKFLSHKAFKDPSNGYLVEDKCVFGAEIFVIQRQGFDECLSLAKLKDSFKCEWKFKNLYGWKFKNFSNLSEYRYSDEFTVGGYKWKLLLYPKSYKDNRGRHISIYVVCVDSKGFDCHQKVKAKASFCIKDQKNGGCNKKLSFTSDRWFENTTQNWGFPNFMPLTELHNKKKGYIVKDCIVVEVELEVLFKREVKKLN